MQVLAPFLVNIYLRDFSGTSRASPSTRSRLPPASTSTFPTQLVLLLSLTHHHTRRWS